MSTAKLTAKKIATIAFLSLTGTAIIGGTWRLIAHAGAGAVNSDCNGSLTATTYPSGIASASLSSTTAISAVVGTGLQLDTNLTPLDPNHIVLPFDQNVKIKYVYRNAGASHTLGWFYLDSISSFLNKPATDPTADLIVGSTDVSGNKLYTWFQSGGLWHVSTGQTAPDLVRSATDYKDTTSTTYRHFPHMLETLMAPGKGSMIFKICDDDNNTSVTTSPNSGQILTPIADSLTLEDSYKPGNGIPDYDVNGNGIKDEVADRTVDLGTIAGNREIVFFLVTYYGSNLREVGLGMAETSSGKTGSSATTQTAYSIPWFTKSILNPDRGGRSAGAVLRKSALGCARDDSACYSGRGGDLGWMDTGTINRLKSTANASDYHLLDLSADTTVKTISVGSDGSVPHFVVFAPNSDPNRWLLAVDDQPEYSSSTSDADYNDVVFLIDHSNGGSAVSSVVSTIPAADLASSVISKVRINYTASFPAGCNVVGDGSIDFYYSVDNGATWHLAGTADKNNLTLDKTIDVLGAGFVGNQLKWRADFKSAVQSCQPVLVSVNEGYEAVKHGEFKYAAPIPLSNVVYSGSLETPPFTASEPAVTRNDFSLRGHLYSERLYDPTAPTSTSLVREWDAGAQLAALSADSRKIYSTVSGALVAFDNTHKSSYETLLLPGTLIGASSPQVSGAYVYDYNGDGSVTTADADFILQWTRGWEYPGTVTFTPAQSALARAWKLGPVHNSSPAIVGPPPAPVWNGAAAVPTSMNSAHSTFRSANVARATIALVGAQDGMLHAFDAGQFRNGTDPACQANLARGCYAGATDAIRYGSGSEVWAWIPPSQLSQLKNNHPSTRTYNSASNTQAEVDGSVAVEDIWDSSTSTFKTIAFVSLGREQPYMTAVDITGSTPAAVWANDFSDTNYNGSELAPSAGLSVIPTSGIPGTFALVTTSGQASTAADEYLYFINPLTGVIIDPANGTDDTTTGYTKGKVKLNAGNANSAYNTTALGFTGYPNLVDSDLDGLIDRVYAVDTSGRIFKYDVKNRVKCVVASTGETVYSGMAIDVEGTVSSPMVTLYLGGAPNPDGSGSTTGGGPGGVYRVFAFQDRDPVGTCTEAGASTVYTQNLGTGEKVWAAPFVGGSDVFYATSATSSVSICSAGNGNLLDLSTTGNGVSPSATGASQTITGTAVSSLRIYDGHALLNTIGGSTTIIGGSAWNNAPTGGGTGGSGSAMASMKTLLWSEQ